MAPFLGLHRNFPNLETVSFEYITDAKNDKFLAMNPQLKRIEFSFCANIDYLLQLIVKYVPEIEAIRLNTNCPRNNEQIKYVGRLRRLKSLEMRTLTDYPLAYITTGIRVISAADICLEHLHLSSFTLRGYQEFFVSAIKQLKSLKTLCLERTKKLTAAHILDICKHLKQLAELRLSRNYGLKLNTADLLELIDSSEKLQKFEINSSAQNACIDVEEHEKLVEMIERRYERISLRIDVLNGAFFTNLPEELARTHKDSLTLNMTFVQS